MTELAKNSLNAKLFWELEGEEYKEFFPIVPTSGITGEGIPDLLSVIIRYTNLYMKNRIKFKDEFNATVMEVKMIEG